MATTAAAPAPANESASATTNPHRGPSARGEVVASPAAATPQLTTEPPGLLDDGETLAQRRAVETAEAARILGAHRVLFLGYRDSGMPDTETNDDPTCFSRAEVDEAARRLATVLADEHPDVFTIYDDHGITGHPDHLQVHRVGTRAAELDGRWEHQDHPWGRDS